MCEKFGFKHKKNLQEHFNCLEGMQKLNIVLRMVKCFEEDTMSVGEDLLNSFPYQQAMTMSKFHAVVCANCH